MPNEGEILRGGATIFACFLSIDRVEVRFYGSEVGGEASIAQKTGGLEPLAIGKVRGFGNLATSAAASWSRNSTNGLDSPAGLAGDSVKGEAFRETLDGVLDAKVRRFGIEMRVMGWKCPADRGLRMSVYRASDLKGEAVRECRDAKRNVLHCGKTGLR